MQQLSSTLVFRFLALLTCSSLLAWSGGAAAQSYPSRAIRVLVGYAPGGPVDAAARIVLPALQKELGQPVVIDNRGGASGALAGQQVAKSAPDGYTLFFAASATQTIAPHVQKGMPYDPLKDYTPIGLVLNAPNVLVVGNEAPVKSVRELVAHAKVNPGKVTFGSAGPGASNHLAGELLGKLTRTQLLHVPYKGNGPAMSDVMGGQITFMFDAVSTGRAAVAGQRVALLAVTSAARHPLLPDVPTMAEAGLADFVVGSFYALEGPPGLPADIVQRLNAALRKVLADADVARRLVDAGYEVTPSSPEELAAKVIAEHARWARAAEGLKFE